MTVLECSFCGKGRNEVEQMIEGPNITDVPLYICNECIDYSHQIIHEDDGLETLTVPHKLYNPEEIKAELDKYVIGQDNAKTAISVAIYNHYKRIDNTDKSIEIDKSNLLMIGPSGCGKTLMVKTIAKLFDMPYVIADATTLTEAGYVGEDVENLVELLIQSADGNVAKAQRGIIFLDEIDKKSRKSENNTGSRDVSGEGVQQALLKLIEGTVVHIQDSYSRSDPIDFDTTDVLFICSGAFVGLDDIIRQGRKQSGIGINAELKEKDVNKELIKETCSEDLIKYGLIPEFVGRCPVLVVFDNLDEETLVRILKEPRNSIVSQFKHLFQIDGVVLEFDDKYLHNVAATCLKQKIGARGLRGIMEKTLQSTQFILPRLAKSGVAKINIDSQGLPIHIYKKSRKKEGNE